jgi:hypothetical protein
LTAGELNSMDNPFRYPRKILDALRALPLIAIMLYSIGCVRRQAQGETSIYSTEPWVIAIIALVAIVVVMGGWFLRTVRKHVAYLIIAGGILVLVTTVPGLSLSRTIIDSDHFEWRRGFKHTSIRFDNLAEIVHTKKRIPIGRVTEDVNYFDFKKKSGETVHVQVEPDSDRFFLDATPEIIRRAQVRGVKYNYAEQ